MAEHFEKPKAFTTAWFSYIWHYYKVHILCVLAAIFLIVITVAEIINTKEYDMHINYIATNMISAKTEERFINAAEEHVSDITGDNEVHLSLTQINFTPEAMQDGNQMMALENKLMTAFASSDEMLYLFDEMMLRDVLSIDATEGVFIPVSSWCETNVQKDELYVHENEACAVKLSNSTLFQQLGVDTSDMYVAVRMNYKPEDETLNKILNNCKNLANALLQ